MINDFVKSIKLFEAMSADDASRVFQFFLW